MKKSSIKSETQRYLAQLAHDMRSPLHSIQGFSYMLFDRCDDAEAKAWIHNIQSVSNHLLDLVNDIVDVHRLNTQQIEIADEAIDIHLLINDCTANFKPQIKTAMIQLKTHFDDHCHRYWRGDRRKLKQILINLISNAIKFTPPQGSVTIDIAQVRHRLRIAVKDTGTGMDEQTLSNLFKLYYQSTSRINQQGTGLGLVITKRLIELMSGELIISSQPGEGSEFIILLPLKQDSQAPSVTQAAESIPQLSQPISMLIVDDDKLHHQVLQGMLSKHPVTLHHCYTMLDALEQCPLIQPDIILIDYQLPDGNGLTLAHTLRHCNSHMEGMHRVTLALLTAHRADDLQDALHDDTLDAMLFKPLAEHDLIRLALNHQAQQGMNISIQAPPLNTPDYLKALWPEFYASIEQGIHDCQQALMHHDFKKLKAAAHQLKGQAMIFHHHAFWQLFESLEDSAQSDKSALLAALLTQITQTYQQERKKL